MNPSERSVRDELHRRGFVVLRAGWPDLLVLRPDGSGFGLELKGPGQAPTPEQLRMHAALARFGLQTVVASYHEAVSEDLETIRQAAEPERADPGSVFLADECDAAQQRTERQRRLTAVILSLPTFPTRAA
jgi:hypothetical protein